MEHFINTIANLLATNDTANAYATCNQWLQLDPNAAEAYHIRGIVQATTGEFTQAIASFEQAILLSPKEAVYYSNLSNAWKKTGNLVQAAANLHEALRIAPNYSEGYNNLGSLYYTQGRIAEAIPCFEKALRLNSSYWEAHFNLANCLIKQDQIIRAISHYESAYAYYPQNITISQNLGMAYVVNKQYSEAMPLLEIASKSDTNNAELQAQLAEVYLELGKVEQAIAQFEIAIALVADRPEWLHNLAVLYLRNHNQNLALKYFQQTLNLQPNNATALHMIAALTGGQSNNAPANYVSSLFDQYAQFYNQHVKTTLEYKVPELLRSIVARNLTINKTINILDLGCGTGLCSIYFKDIAKFLVGVDLSSNMLACAKSLKSYDALCQADIATAIPGYNLAYFDLIIAADVLVYCGALETIFANCSQALANGGYFAFTIEETSVNNDYVLTTTGRFAHTKNYISSLAAQFNFHMLEYQQCDLRKANQQVINGAIILLSKSIING